MLELEFRIIKRAFAYLHFLLGGRVCNPCFVSVGFGTGILRVEIWGEVFSVIYLKVNQRI
jgi:hypothetical protein